MANEGRFQIILLLTLLTLIGGGEAIAASNQSIVYQGRIARPDGTFPNTGNIKFTLSIYSPSPKKCLLYSETQTMSMVGARGMFSLKLGEGTHIGGVPVVNNAFITGATVSGLTCGDGVSTSYTPAANDDRDLIVSFEDNGTVVHLAAMNIQSIPYALQANKIDGWGVNDIVKIHPTVGSPTTFTTAEMAIAKTIAGLACANNEVIKWNGTTWACATDATGGASSDAGYGSGNKGIVAFDADAATSGISIASGIAKINFGTGANQIVKLDGTSKLPAVDGSALTNLSAANLSGSVPINKGGTGQTTQADGFNALSPLSAKGALIVHNGTNNISLPVGSNNQILTADSAEASGLKWKTATSGTVTEVTSANSDIAVATTTSTPVLTLNSGTAANQIVKLDGSAKLPALDGSALTNVTASGLSGVLAVANGGTGATSFTGNHLVGMNGTGTVQQSVTCAQNQVISFDASGYYGCYNVSSLVPGFVNGGNSFGANSILGNIDNYDLAIQTNNVARINILKTGNVGIGETNPTHGFQVKKDTIYFSDTSGKSFMYATQGKIMIGSSSSPSSLLHTSDTGSRTTDITGVTHAIGNISSTASITKTGVDIQSTGAWNGAGAVNIGLNVNATGGTKNYAAIFQGGNVGIGTTSPAAKLEVAGQIVSKVHDNGASTTFDFNNGNSQYTTASCGAITLQNMVDGGTYTIAVQGGTSGTCVFTHSGETFKFYPANAATTAGTESVYTMLKMGSKVYVSWISGF